MFNPHHKTDFLNYALDLDSFWHQVLVTLHQFCCPLISWKERKISGFRAEQTRGALWFFHLLSTGCQSSQTSQKTVYQRGIKYLASGIVSGRKSRTSINYSIIIFKKNLSNFKRTRFLKDFLKSILIPSNIIHYTCI